MNIIDINTTFGKHIQYDYDLSLPTLLQELDTHRVAGAVTCSLKGVAYDARTGNRETLAAARAHPHLVPAATLDLREYLGWEAEIEYCLQSGCRLFRFFPEEQTWSIHSLFFRKVLEKLRGAGVCVMLSLGGLSGNKVEPEDIARLTAGHGLSLILSDTNYNNMAEVMMVARTYPHVYIETNWHASVGAYEVLAQEVGVERLLYGSAALLHPMQKALNAVLEADLSQQDKAAILGGNAMKLLSISPEKLQGRPALEDLEPQKFDHPIIDVHSHLGFWRVPVPHEGYDSSGMRRRMKRFDITRSILSSYEGMRYDIEAANHDLAQGIAGHPELLGYVELNPHQLQQSITEMDKYYRLPNFAGAEIELTHTVHPTGSPEVKALVAEIAKRGKPVLFKPASAGDALAERDLALQNPDLMLIHAHSMDGNWARIVKDAPNIYVEFCASQPSHNHIRDCLAELGPERLLFGTDQTFLSVGASIGLYLDAGLGPREQRLILYENARRIFKIS
ncbi:MAG: hypothetical protein EXR62_17165 [Chloroflexi bacterium]|nr:hypothetical protein [Chloroflexota bacterium]